MKSFAVEVGPTEPALSFSRPNVARAMMWFQQLRQPDGLVGKLPYWAFLNWSNPDKTGETSILHALYAHTLENAAQMVDFAGEAFHA